MLIITMIIINGTITLTPKLQSQTALLGSIPWEEFWNLSILSTAGPEFPILHRSKIL
jgi:hypothetical protein